MFQLSFRNKSIALITINSFGLCDTERCCCVSCKLDRQTSWVDPIGALGIALHTNGFIVGILSAPASFGRLAHLSEPSNARMLMVWYCNVGRKPNCFKSIFPVCAIGFYLVGQFKQSWTWRKLGKHPLILVLYNSTTAVRWGPKALFFSVTSAYCL